MLVLGSKSLPHLSSSISLTSWLVVWMQGITQDQNDLYQNFITFHSVYKERIWQWHNLGLILDQHIQHVVDIQLCYMCPLERQLSMGDRSLPTAQLVEGFAWFPSVDLQSFVRWQAQKFVSPGSSPSGYWEKRVLLLSPVLVPVSHSTVGMKVAQQTGRKTEDLACKFLPRPQPFCIRRYISDSRNTLCKHLQF